MKEYTRPTLMLTAFVVASLLGGCASPCSRVAKPLVASTSSGLDLKVFRVATVLPFDVQDTSHADLAVGARLAQDITDRLKYDFGELFTDVRQGPALGNADEIVVTGSITKYRPGSKAARFMMAGVGAASLEGQMVLKQGDTKQVLMTAPFDKLWAWGGTLGISKGIEEMTTEVGAACASTVARARGWAPKQ